MKFYEDQLYIEMCGKAREIQEDYDKLSEYKKANFFLVDGMVSQCGKCGFICASNFCPDCGGKMKDQDMYRLDHNVNTRPGTFTIWLPRLDQLIEMLGYDNPGPTQAQIAVMQKEFGHIGDTWETCFLRLYMHAMWGKKWDFEKKEWVRV